MSDAGLHRSPVFASDGGGTNRMMAAPRSSMTAVPPNRMTAAERLDEVAAILADGCLRLIARNRLENVNNIKEKRKFGLDLAGERSVHGENMGTGESK